MSETHPSRARLEQFMHGALEAVEAREVVSHLLTDCARCKTVTGAMWRGVEEGLRASHQDAEQSEEPQSSPYGAILERAISRASRQAVDLGRERAAAPALLAKLITHPQPRRLTVVRNSRRYQSWGLCELLIDGCYDCRFDEVQTGVELAEVAVVTAQQLDPEAYGPRPIRDLQGRAWAYLGNAQRVASDLRAADRAFEEARKCFEEGTNDPLDRALLSRFRAHLLRARRRFDGALRLQQKAIALYRKCGETDLLARTLSDQGLGFLYAGDAEKAIPLFDEALELMDAERQPRMVAAARHNLALCLSDIGEHESALRLLRRVRPVYREHGDRISLVRVRWLEGRILTGLGQDELAEVALLEARDALIDEGVAYDAALVSLDLAGVYAAQGRSVEMRRLAEQMVPIFESRDVHREALAALVIFRRAAEAERASLALVQQIGAYLHAARHDPELKFRCRV